MRSVNERFKEYLEIKNIDGPTHYKAIKIPKTLWSNYKEGERAIPLNTVCEIVKYFKDLNSRWLLTGEGSMFVEYEQTDKQYTSQDNPQPLKNTRYCTDPACNARILELETQVNILISHIGSLNRREDPPEKYDAGGVEKTRRQYPGKAG